MLLKVLTQRAVPEGVLLRTPIGPFVSGCVRAGLILIFFKPSLVFISKNVISVKGNVEETVARQLPRELGQTGVKNSEVIKNKDPLESEVKSVDRTGKVYTGEKKDSLRMSNSKLI